MSDQQAGTPRHLSPFALRQLHASVTMVLLQLGRVPQGDLTTGERRLRDVCRVIDGLVVLEES